ncbi:hypothetical protein E8E13_008568 [Curvularia kusanoi]|uniref:Uncharacterized protein n=1 Tax=Curvularia kusanoi TaxID=90978 RepID=A0A9P4W9B0_CURKU|nr:hypothetical protein E8E13_008568 [Curvularia kusanoi]
MRLCPVLQNRLRSGCRIINADAEIFGIIVAHLDLVSTFQLTKWLHAPGHLRDLTIFDKALLTFVQAWHLCVLRGFCVAAQEKEYASELQLDTEEHIDPEPFQYLDDTIGAGSKAESFLIDHYAGLWRLQPDNHNLGLLSLRVAMRIKRRWIEIRLASGISKYDLGKPGLAKPGMGMMSSTSQVDMGGWFAHTVPQKKADGFETELQIRYVEVTTGGEEAVFMAVP